MAQFPNRIRELRAARSWSQDTLALAVGCAKPTISDLERGNMQLTVDWMRKIAWALDVTPADLLNLDDHPMSLSPAERELIERLREATPEQQETFQKVADAFIPWRSQRKEEAA